MNTTYFFERWVDEQLKEERVDFRCKDIRKARQANQMIEGLSPQTARDTVNDFCTHASRFVCHKKLRTSQRSDSFALGLRGLRSCPFSRRLCQPSRPLLCHLGCCLAPCSLQQRLVSCQQRPQLQQLILQLCLSGSWFQLSPCLSPWFPACSSSAQVQAQAATRARGFSASHRRSFCAMRNTNTGITVTQQLRTVGRSRRECRAASASRSND